MKKLFLLGLFSFFLFTGCNIVNDNDNDDEVVYDYSYVGTWTYSWESGTEYKSIKAIYTKTTYVLEYSSKFVKQDGEVTRKSSSKSSGTIQNLGNYKIRQIPLKQEIGGTMYDVRDESTFRSAYEKEFGTETDSAWAETYNIYTSSHDTEYSISGNKMTVGETVYTKQ
ncbi:hypothetical protein [Spirochaeta cellobiosiphila]|uniref:hypothetical protein n=1 Tax=Spirochaeta cellobiosiphila TaxID=504483 RepID=UPI0003F58CA9|nr:hypothetical protein [Spirochaeta cellobiosiphila]